MSGGTCPVTGATREIRGYQAVRLAAKDHEAYSSDLLGDRDVRTFKQLPLEVDPPRHAMYREALQPWFLGTAVAVHDEAFAAIAQRLIDRVTAVGQGEVASEVALPYVMGCLAELYGRPQDLDEWISWGPDVWTAEAYARGEVTAESRAAQRERNFDSPTQRSGATLHAYLDRVLTAAMARAHDGVEPVDVWDELVRLDLGGRAPTIEEANGIANILLAGGRDTVIKLITGIVWHLIRTPADREFLAATPTAHSRAVSEFVRYLSPLHKIERLETTPSDGCPVGGDHDAHVLLNFASANHDPTAWEHPGVIDIHRPRQPHLGFGFGRHSCLGMNVAEREAKAFLRVLLANWPSWELASEPEIEWVEEGEMTFLASFESVPVTVDTRRPEPSGE
ncbi:cytochrome P450 [Agromyces mediolanus]|uniref:cytochrome P450 n=1 Tax=Agromyces mediolanus TaxID=41986 RepID=UPI0020411DAF|nr:cytochrome P450 [Agromyces mediolanus]MCM3658369.1 cytochrome P450 [Agromyces mediolanus]